MQKPFHHLTEADLQTAWKWTLRICAAYGALLTVFAGLMVYDLTVATPRTNTAQARVAGPNQPSARSGPTELAVAGKVR